MRRVMSWFVVLVVVLGCAVVQGAASSAMSDRCTILGFSLSSSTPGSFNFTASPDRTVVDYEAVGAATLDCPMSPELDGTAADLTLTDHIAFRQARGNGWETFRSRSLLSITVNPRDGTFTGQLTPRIRGTGLCEPSGCSADLTYSDRTRRSRREHVHLDVTLRVTETELVELAIGPQSYIDTESISFG